MTATTKSLVFAALALAATAARASDERWEVEGAFPAFPATVAAPVAAAAPAPAAPVVKAAPVAAKLDKSGCPLTVSLKSVNAVGLPCNTTADVMNALGLSAKAQARVEHLAKSGKVAKKKAAH